jgi:hypothetical protein
VDAEAFVKAVEERLLPINPIIEFAIKRQLYVVRADRRNMTPEQAAQFIEKMSGALELFVGPTKARQEREFMINILRKTAPGFKIRNDLS